MAEKCFRVKLTGDHREQCRDLVADDWMDAVYYCLKSWFKWVDTFPKGVSVEELDLSDG